MGEPAWGLMWAQENLLPSLYLFLLGCGQCGRESLAGPFPALGHVLAAPTGQRAALCCCVDILFKFTLVARICALQVLIHAASFPEVRQLVILSQGSG